MVSIPGLSRHAALIIGALCLLATCVQSAVQVSRWQTAQFTGDRLTPQSPLYWQSSDFSAPITVTLDSSQRFQQILGFGGAFTEAGAYVFSTMNDANRKQILNAYFGPNGLNYTLCRMHMNSADFSLGSYNHDNVTGDYSLFHFDIARDRQWLLPYIKAALSTSAQSSQHDPASTPLRIFFTPWSPPGWMKTNGDMNGSDKPCLIARPEIYSSWALYFSKFISAYKQEGINLWGLTVQNEPEFAAPYEACVFTPEGQRDFIARFLGPRIKSDHPDVKILIYDHNRDHIFQWVKVITSDPIAASYVSGTAFHWYTDGGYENLDHAHQAAPDKFLLASEATQDPDVILGDWRRGESYGFDIIRDLQHWAVGWVDWNMLLDMKGGPTHFQNWCDAPIIGDAQTQTVHLQIMYYYMGHISKWIAPGSVRITSLLETDGTTDKDDLLVVAFLTPASNTVFVVMNQSDRDFPTIKVVDRNLGLFLRISSPKHSIQTFLYRG